MSKWVSTKVGKNQPEKQNQCYIIERIPSVKSFSNLGNSFASLAWSEFGAASIAEAKHRAAPICAFGSYSVKIVSAKGFRLRERERERGEEPEDAERHRQMERKKKLERRRRERTNSFLEFFLKKILKVKILF